MHITENSKNIIPDKWLTKLLKKETYKIAVDDGFIKKNGKKLIKDLQSKDSFLYTKVPVDHLSAVKFLESMNFYLIDTNVTFVKPVSQKNKLKSRFSIRFARPSEEKKVAALAGKSFRFSRFHMDENFSSKTANALKAEWARNYFKGARGKYMIVALSEKRIVGFLQLLQGVPEVITIDLIAVHPTYRRRGIALDMIAYAEKNCKEIKQIKTGTQLVNIPVIRMYEKMGFRMKDIYYVFHCFSSGRKRK